MELIVIKGKAQLEMDRQLAYHGGYGEYSLSAMCEAAGFPPDKMTAGQWIAFARPLADGLRDYLERLAIRDREDVREIPIICAILPDDYQPADDEDPCSAGDVVAHYFLAEHYVRHLDHREGT